MLQPISILPQTPLEITSRGAINPRDFGANGASPGKSYRAPTFAVYTLGCKVNQSDSHVIARMLQSKGFRRVEFRDSADLYVIDTCTVTSEADKKSRKAAARAQRNNPDAVVAVTGCAATYSAEQFARVAPGALVLSNARKFELPELALQKLRSRRDWDEDYLRWREESASEPVFQPTAIRAVLKIQDGCNHQCSYCIIPTVRGASVLKTPEAIVREARILLEEGAGELVVTGVSMGDFRISESVRGRKDSSGGRNRALCDLLRELATLPGLSRLRVSSLDPADVDEEYLQTIAHTPKVCPHIHLALQSGSAGVLRRMRRRYTPQLFMKWARRWREIAPEGGLTTDIIVGFPGETEDEFQESLQLAQAAQFSAIHVFPYSPRDGTAAAGLGGFIDPKTQSRRVDELLELARETSARYAQQFVGRTTPILVEQIKDGSAIGLTENYLKAKVRLAGQDGPAVGGVISLTVRDWDGENLNGNDDIGMINDVWAVGA